MGVLYGDRIAEGPGSQLYPRIAERPVSVTQSSVHDLSLRVQPCKLKLNLVNMGKT